MPSMDFLGSGGGGGGVQTSLSIESDPPGADARTSTGAGCRTPCSLPIQISGDFTVNVSLNGYLPQSVPVRLIPPDDPRFVSEGMSVARLDPNPVFVVLEKAPPPPPPAKKRPPKKRTTAATNPPAAPARTAAPALASPAPTPQPAPAASAPWPMPR